jgi:hypothetical protein
MIVTMEREQWEFGSTITEDDPRYQGVLAVAAVLRGVLMVLARPYKDREGWRAEWEVEFWNDETASPTPKD